MAQPIQVRPDLMTPPGKRLHLQQRGRVQPLDYAVPRLRRLAPRIYARSP